MKIPDAGTTRTILDIVQNGTSGAFVEHNTTLSSGLNSIYSSQTQSATNIAMSTTTATLTATASTTERGQTFTTLSRFLSSLASTTSTPGQSTFFASTTESLAVGGTTAVDELTNTPLNAPQPSLEPVSTDHPLLGSSGGLSDLGWLIPTVIVCTAAMLGFAYACYYGVRRLELRFLGWCYRNCSCCCVPGNGEGGRLLGEEQFDTLSEETSKKGKWEAVRLRDYREQSPSYGVTRTTSKEYTPKMFNPFDDDS